jgi:hypothetical protein
MGSKGKLITVASMAVALIVALATIQSTQASIDYWLEKPEALVLGVNHITVYAKNGGGMDGDFHLIITFTNATFSTQTELPYVKVDDSTVKIKFVLHKGDAKEKIIYFTTNQTCPVNIKLTLERTSLIQFLKPNELYPAQLTYTWNNENQAFNCTNAQ